MKVVAIEMLGSARASRAGFGASPKQALVRSASNRQQFHASGVASASTLVARVFQ
jgi:hypothetical protein